MKFRKIAAAVISAAMAVSMMAVNAFAATTIQLDSDYAGNWGAGECISKDDLLAVGGDVKITLDIETIDPTNEKQFLVTPMDYSANGWPRITSQCTSDTIVAKEDQFICIVQGETSVEFVVPESVIEGLTVSDDGVGGIGFQVCNVIVKSATLEAGTPEAQYRIIDNDNVIPYCYGEYEMPAADTSAAPASDTAVEETTSPSTGNASAAVILSVMAVAGTAAFISKRK